MPFAESKITASPLAGCLTDLRLDRQLFTGTALLCCPSDFPAFTGHFPGQPVLPAVLQLLAVRLLSESLIGGGLSPLSVERLKFKGMILPNETINVRISLREQDNEIKSEFRLDRAGAPIASGALLFRRLAGEGC